MSTLSLFRISLRKSVENGVAKRSLCSSSLLQDSKRKDTLPPKKQLVCDTRVRGVDIIRDPKTNKGMAFTIKERQMMGLHGLLPPCVINQEQQVYRTMRNFYAQPDDLNRFLYLTQLQDRNEKLFYRVLTDNVELMMPIVYTPTVGMVCQKFGFIYRKPKGLYITLHDKGHIYSLLCNWQEKNVQAIVVTDGERILGLGDLGAYGMGIPVGKLALYTALGGIKPMNCLPIVIDVGTNNPDLLDDPLYIGLKHKRARGKLYEELMDEFMEAVVQRYGKSCLVQFEDFGNQNAFTFLERYRDDYCTFNDDIQGTAAVAVAGILASLRITGKKLSDNVFLFQGAGEASIGIAQLIVMAMMEEGTSESDALSKIWMVDSRGLITKDRKAGGVTGHKVDFAKDHADIKDLREIVNAVKPTAIVGAAAIPRVFTKEIIEDMSSFNDRPIIFALSNPTSSAECTAEEAYRYSNGRCVFASGSPFDPVVVNNQTFYPGQGNNAYIFPGVALAAVTCHIRRISDRIFLKSAEILADMVTEEHLKEGRVYPPLSDIREVSTKIAVGLAEYAYTQDGVCGLQPPPEDKDAFIRGHQYSTNYEDFEPDLYDWPDV